MGEADDTDWQPRRQHRTPAYVHLPSQIDHYPSDDAGCKALVTQLGVYDWELLRGKGAHLDHPWRLQTDINGTRNIIHLPWRKGHVLAWLRGKREDLEAEQ